ncbi:Ankyrin repeat-containing domain [Trinorchestia longiramus]|nr:Ankyrin repeat-containing domain [Trinorchestia longiramus]
MDHRELIAEMAYIEKLSTQERLKLARRRRIQQLKKHCQLEKESLSASKREKTKQNEAYKRRRQNSKRVIFVSSVMLLEAAARNDIDEVRDLLQSGSVSPNATNEDGLTALHQCCIDDSAEMLTLLLHYGADVNAADSEKWTPLHAAATCGHLHLAQLLVQHGANLLAVNADGNMPYDICEDDATLDYIECEMARRGVTQAMIDATRTTTETAMLAELRQMRDNGESLLVRDHQNATPLHIAAANGYMRVCEFLLSHNFPLELRDADDWTPLHAAACWGHPDVLELLVLHGANLHARNKHHETPYDISEDHELRERLMQLLSEQETRRLGGDHRSRVRRGHSANTRTQSVRRTSIREKSLAAKREAQEEARMRMSITTDAASDANNGSVVANDSPDDTNVSDGGDLQTTETKTNYENSDTALDQGTIQDGLKDSIPNSSDSKLKNGSVSSTDEVDFNRHDINGEKHTPSSFVQALEKHSIDKEKDILANDIKSQEYRVPANASPPLGYSETRVRRTSVSRSALSVSKKPKQESDYGRSFYNRSWEYTEGGKEATEDTAAKAVTDEEEIYYDDSVNSGYSDSDLVLSHFGSNSDTVSHLKSTVGSCSPSTTFPAVVTTNDQCEVRNMSPQTDLNYGHPLSSLKPSLVTNFPSVVADSSELRQDLEKNDTSIDNSKDGTSHVTKRRRWAGDDRYERSVSEGVPDVGQGASRGEIFDISPSMERSSSERGLLTSTEDSVVPLLDPQPDLIPESARRKPAPKPPQKPPNLLSGIHSSVHPVAPQGTAVSQSPLPSHANLPPQSVTVSQVTETEPRSSPASMAPPPPSQLCAQVQDKNLAQDDSSTMERRSSQQRPVPPPRLSSIKSDDGEADTVDMSSMPSRVEDEKSSEPKFKQPEKSVSSEQKRVSNGQPTPSDLSRPESQVQLKSPAFDPQVNQAGSNAIDIHVTVTVKPLAPGTLADLKQQRALNRGSHTSPSSDGGSIASSTLGRAGGDAVGMKAVSRSSQGYSIGEDNLAYENNSVSGDRGQPVPPERSVPSNSVTYKAPVSPTLPRKYRGEPSSDYSTPTDSNRCCILL